jgi:maltooligosyltrehalose trehalohydrolase
MHRFVICLQNHDQIGNRAHGDRLNQHVDAATWRSISVLLLTAPMTPLLFMGQEWAATTPFLYFTDLDEDLGRMVTEGRRREFQAFPEFADPHVRSSIPDPQAVGTFLASRLRWDERDERGHAVTLALYRRLLQLRREHEALGASDALSADATALDADTIVMRRTCGTGPAFLIVVRLRGEGAIDPGGHAGESPRGWRVLLTTEDDAFTIDPQPLRIDSGTGAPVIHFPRPGAVILMR